MYNNIRNLVSTTSIMAIFVSKDNKSCCIICTIILIVCGIVILLVGAIGYPIMKHQNSMFESTQCTVIDWLPLMAKTCDDVVCNAAVWKVQYLVELENINSTIRGKYKKSNEVSGKGSEELALEDLHSRPIGSIWLCFFNHNNHLQVKWDLVNLEPWLDTLISGAVITLSGIILYIYFRICLITGNPSRPLLKT